jgi:hypothetical protein
MFVRFVEAREAQEELSQWEPSRLILEMSVAEADMFVNSMEDPESFKVDYAVRRNSAVRFTENLTRAQITRDEDPQGHIGMLFNELGNFIGFHDLTFPDEENPDMNWRQIPPVEISSPSELSKWMSIWLELAERNSVLPLHTFWRYERLSSLPMNDFFSTYNVLSLMGLEYPERGGSYRSPSESTDYQLYLKTLVSYLPGPVHNRIPEDLLSILSQRNECIAEWERRTSWNSSSNGSIYEVNQYDFFIRALRVIDSMKVVEEIVKKRGHDGQELMDDFLQFEIDDLIDIVAIASLIEWSFFKESAFALTIKFHELNLDGRQLTFREKYLITAAASSVIGIALTKDKPYFDAKQQLENIQKYIGSDMELAEKLLEIADSRLLTEDDF